MYAPRTDSLCWQIAFRLRRILLVTLGSVLIMVPAATALAAAAGTPVTVAVEDPRPVAKAIQGLITQYGYRVTYEDPAYEYDGDLVDRHEGRSRDRIPAGGGITLSYTPMAAMSTPADMAGLLAKLLQTHAAADHGGRFRLLQSEQDFHVVPMEIKDKDGNWVSQESVLDLAITLPSKTRSGMVMLQDICAAITAVSHRRVVVGTIPYNIILPYSGSLSAENETARTVLTRALDGTKRRLTWMLLYDPSTKSYFLNVLGLPDHSSAEPGVSVTSPAGVS